MLRLVSIEHPRRGGLFPTLYLACDILMRRSVFVKMRDGDRLGHALALGIEPQWWMARQGEMILPADEHWIISSGCGITPLR
ncbi:Uncharacterised protein [Klebsiella pneumoniae]|nr:Uncharacterised protein [Klebsiella pneumoniae]